MIEKERSRGMMMGEKEEIEMLLKYCRNVLCCSGNSIENNIQCYGITNKNFCNNDFDIFQYCQFGNFAMLVVLKYCQCLKFRNCLNLGNFANVDNF